MTPTFVLSCIIQSPDDNGECSTHTTEASCLAKKSMLDNSQDKCMWVTPEEAPDDSYFTEPYCAYRPPVITVKV